MIAQNYFLTTHILKVYLTNDCQLIRISSLFISSIPRLFNVCTILLFTAVRESFQILSKAKNGKIPVAVQCLPPVPLNLFLWTSSFLPRKIREDTKKIMMTGYTRQQLTFVPT